MYVGLAAILFYLYYNTLVKRIVLHLKFCVFTSQRHHRRYRKVSQGVVNRRNSLSEEHIDAHSVNSFKNRLERRPAHQMDFLKRDLVL